MTFLLKLFSSIDPPSPTQAITNNLNSLKLDSSSPLPDNYHELLFATPHQPHQVLTQILIHLQQATSEAAVIKLYTIIMCAIRISDYDEILCSALEQIPEAIFCGKEERVTQMEKSCRSYLAKLPSMSDLYHSALMNNNQQAEQQHVALFRYLNHFSLLFPLLNTAINTVGRYYKDSMPFYREFYRVWRAQALLGYLQIKKIVDNFILYYRTKDTEIISCFLDSVPEIELLCDQMECLITNKYFRGKSPNKKVYFKEQTLQEMEYYLSEAIAEGKKEEDFIRTADDDFFGNSQ